MKFYIISTIEVIIHRILEMNPFEKLESIISLNLEMNQPTPSEMRQHLKTEASIQHLCMSQNSRNCFRSDDIASSWRLCWSFRSLAAASVWDKWQALCYLASTSVSTLLLCFLREFPRPLFSFFICPFQKTFHLIF